MIGAQPTESHGFITIDTSKSNIWFAAQNRVHFESDDMTVFNEHVQNTRVLDSVSTDRRILAAEPW